MIYFMAGYITGSLWALLMTIFFVRRERRTDEHMAAEELSEAKQDSLNSDENDEKEKKERRELQKRLDKQWENLMNYTGKKQA